MDSAKYTEHTPRSKHEDSIDKIVKNCFALKNNLKQSEESESVVYSSERSVSE